jgi:hypothetical protein
MGGTMSNKLPVYIIMTTYDRGDGTRTKIAAESAESIAERLVYPNLRWIITDDGSSNHEEHVRIISDSILKHAPETSIEVFNINRQGVGVAKNTALQRAFNETPIVLLTEDDWFLTETFDLLPYVQLLLDHIDVGIIRLGYLGGDMQARLVEYNGITFWRLLQGSGVYVYSGQISLRHQRFYDAVGFHNEGMSPGEEELAMCFRYNSAGGGANAPYNIFPTWNCPVLNRGIFTNIGLGNSTNAIIPGT